MKKRSILISVIAIICVILSACGNSSASGKKEVKTITVGTGTQFPNVCFIDKSGKLTGYDVELVREIDRRLPDYKFKFKTMDFANLLVSLAARKVDMVAHEMEPNPERKKKFLFNKVAYNNFPTKITVLQSNKTIKGVKDLNGKTVVTSATSNESVVLKKIDEQNGNKFKITYAGQGSNDEANQLKSGRADATLSTPFAVDFQNKTSPIKEKVVGDVLSNQKVYFMFNKGDTQLSGEIDKALREIIKDGTLKKLSEKWLGADYSKASY